MRRLNVHSFVHELNTVCNYLHASYDINFGGCCFVAAEIAKYLDRMHLEYRLGIYDLEDKNIEEINKEVQNKVLNYNSSVTGEHSCSHYFLHIKGGGSINVGSPYIGYNKYYIDNINHTNIQWIYKHGSWNSHYNTNYNPFVKNTLKAFFQRYVTPIS